MSKDQICKECGEKFQGRKRKFCNAQCAQNYKQNTYKTFSKHDVTSGLQDEELGGDWLPGACNLPTQVLELLETYFDPKLNRSALFEGSALFDHQEYVQIKKALQELPAAKYQDGSPYVSETSKDALRRSNAMDFLVGSDYRLREHEE